VCIESAIDQSLNDCKQNDIVGKYIYILNFDPQKQDTCPKYTADVSGLVITKVAEVLWLGCVLVLGPAGPEGPSTNTKAEYNIRVQNGIPTTYLLRQSRDPGPSTNTSTGYLFICDDRLLPAGPSTKSSSSRFSRVSRFLSWVKKTS